MDAILVDIVKGVGTSSPFLAFMVWLYWRTDGRLAALQDQYVKLIADTISSRTELAVALDKIADKVGA